ncbi:MAG: acetyl-CoA carboxylase carboxyl transferase subunit beta [Candidatus Petromonas sp.]|jgi:acetyl-CoA carboxylase carboxyl transferase subunit beta|nr:acetyl-CoA carboxylase carboxyl transferase subunit beta [Candidatus Petromonas sp.]
MISEFLRKKKKYVTINLNEKEDKKKTSMNIEFANRIVEKDIDEKIWIKCSNCSEILLSEDVEKNLYICNKCDYHFRMGARDRLSIVLDENSFKEYDKELKITNPLDFPGYSEKISKALEKSGEDEAVITGEGKINGIQAVVCAMEPKFMMGSMGCVVGEKISRAIERATRKRLPLIIFSASGGARMQEGILSLMQMAKTSAALSRFSEKRLPYVSVLTDPTTGGVTASFAMLGDIIISEPGALIGFAGPRVIEQTIRQRLPEGFQRAEFLKERGFVDKIVHRKNLREILFKILYIHTLEGEVNE